ncbi:hypothetical protein C0Q70_05978 [Pomacea canaliculata]|uniref:Uncharacterized protein n=1 Tax=Pomacea canaliculata TaxID=400727 RepID=A0A2T7PMQ6_POMCA|nr:hypothetical protein C0Q70_05978 [Pomacea canaliculata]
MSASDEEDFASAEEGEEIKGKKPVKKGAKGEQNRPSSAKGKQSKRSTGDKQGKQKKKEAESINKETPRVGETAKGSVKKCWKNRKAEYQSQHRPHTPSAQKTTALIINLQ